MLTKHNPGPYPEYFDIYIRQLPDSDIFTLLEEQQKELQVLLQNLPEAAAACSYEEGKWSVKQVVGHMLDAERVFFYRCLCISRGEKQSLPGFDENAYVEQANFNQRSLSNLSQEYAAQRQATLAFYKTLNPQMLSLIGITNNIPVSVKAMVIVTAAHELHHLNIIKSRYLPVINQA